MITLVLSDHMRAVRHDSPMVMELSKKVLEEEVYLILNEDVHPLDVMGTTDWLRTCGAAAVIVCREGHDC